LTQLLYKTIPNCLKLTKTIHEVLSFAPKQIWRNVLRATKSIVSAATKQAAIYRNDELGSVAVVTKVTTRSWCRRVTRSYRELRCPIIS